MLNAYVQASRRGGAILCFHSVTTPALPGEGTSHVSVKAFTSFIRVARRLGELVPLSELVRRHTEGRSTSGLIAVTFDDAYAAVLTELKDVIARQAIPVAVFVVTNAAARGAKYLVGPYRRSVPAHPSRTMARVRGRVRCARRLPAGTAA